MMHLLVRLFLIPLGYILAVVAAASAAALAEWLRAYGPVAEDPAALGLTGLVVLTDWVAMIFVIGRAAAIPSLIAVALTEAFAFRHALFFGGAGLVIAFAVSRLVDPTSVPPFAQEPAIAAATGLVGGLAYWLVAGRGSGLRRLEPARA